MRRQTQLTGQLRDRQWRTQAQRFLATLCPPHPVSPPKELCLWLLQNLCDVVTTLGKLKCDYPILQRGYLPEATRRVRAELEFQGRLWHQGQPSVPADLHYVTKTGPQEFWHTPLSPAVQRGPLHFYKSRFIYSPGPSALPGIYRFLSDCVSGEKYKWHEGLSR